jgi:hypothetical protein
MSYENISRQNFYNALLAGVSRCWLTEQFCNFIYDKNQVAVIGCGSVPGRYFPHCLNRHMELVSTCDIIYEQ